MTTSDLLTHILELMAQSITQRTILDHQTIKAGNEVIVSAQLNYLDGEIKAYQSLIKKLCLPTN